MQQSLAGQAKIISRKFPSEDIFGHSGSSGLKIINGWTWAEQRVEAQVVTIERVLTVFSLSVKEEFNCVITASLFQTHRSFVRFFYVTS